tara:strand:+ start:37818 stop:37958 length:141 start_codon:yes stop_codon:yes gene_type:complete
MDGISNLKKRHKLVFALMVLLALPFLLVWKLYQWAYFKIKDRKERG